MCCDASRRNSDPTRHSAAVVVTTIVDFKASLEPKVLRRLNSALPAFCARQDARLLRHCVAGWKCDK
ncbi:hypothetical protein LshimejAT787_1700360 [Lyophyllum shimeji]|uniref:Uncharacterized protein n=1 Tax=Lyophyllum shimeji TaxID=47721 RepID=A0A9P3UQW3_LYOSH|nr:hypothetical protein LshimejAT787_1700360 [Lyophyllum shimeji]